MSKGILYICLSYCLLFLFNCSNQSNKKTDHTHPATDEFTSKIDLKKRNALVKKYDLLNFSNLTSRVFLSVDEFFDGNNDEASIAPNPATKPKISEYYKTIKEILKNKKTLDAFVELNEVLIYDNGQLHDNEWFYTNTIYIVGDLSKEEIAKKTKPLFPSEVNYTDDERILELNEKFKSKKIVYIWWD